MEDAKYYMNTTTTSELARTKSDQLVVELAAAATLKSPPGSGDLSAAEGSGGSGSLTRKYSSRRSSPGGRNTNTHIRKARSAHTSLKAEIDEVISSGAALSRASSASLGLSFSFTGFSLPPDQIADSKPFSDDDDILVSLFWLATS